MFKKIYLVLLIISLIFTSCNKEDSSNLPDTNETEETDETDETDSTLIGDFELSITNITLYTAQLDWTEADNAENYEVYLDEMLLESNVSDFQYTIVGLEKGTSHQVKVIAKNTENSLEKTSSFTTLEEANLLIKSIKFDKNEDEGTYFTYDSNQNLIKKEVIGCSQNNNELYTLNEYEYNTEGKITNETAYAPWGDQTYRIDYSYNGENLSSIEKYELYIDGTYANFEYLFHSETAYTIDVEYFSSSGDPTNHIIYEGEIARDTQNRITRIDLDETNGDGSYDYNGTIIFTYEDGNLIDIHYEDYPYGLIHIIIEYDDKPNFHTYFSGTEFSRNQGNSCFRYDVMGLIHLKFLYYEKEVYDMLPFFSNTNKNNPIKYYESSSSPRVEFFYEYNDYDYPSSVNFIGPPPNTVEYNFNFTYEVIE